MPNREQTDYDIAIIGAGPAGVFNAYELAQLYGKNASIGLFDQGLGIDQRHCPAQQGGKGCVGCRICAVTDGVMGAGLKSDGKLHFHPDIIEAYRMGLLTETFAYSLLRYLEEQLEIHGLEGPVYPTSQEEAKALSAKIAELNLGDNFELKEKQRTRHAGSDLLPAISRNIINQIQTRGNAQINTGARMVNFKPKDNGQFELNVISKGAQKTITSRTLVIGLGRKGGQQAQQIIQNNSINHTYRPVEIGGRIETLYPVFKPLTDVVYNPCFRQQNPQGMATFTFCTNPQGFLTTETLMSGITGVNGESRKFEKSDKTNFAVLTELPIPQGLTPNDALTDLLRQSFSKTGPIGQTTHDFVNGTIHDQHYPHNSTLSGWQYRNISDFLPPEITQELRTFLLRLNKVSPGVISHESLYILPEGKIRGIRVQPTPGLMTNIDGLYMIGESSGLGTNIVAAAITGIVAARDIHSSGKYTV